MISVIDPSVSTDTPAVDEPRDPPGPPAPWKKFASVNLLSGSKHRRRKVQVFTRDDFRCVYCGCDFLGDLDALLTAQVDHLVPRAAGGHNALSNLVASCPVCNQLKDGAIVTNVAHGREVVMRRRVEAAEYLATEMDKASIEFPRKRAGCDGRAGPVSSFAYLLGDHVEAIGRLMRMLGDLANHGAPTNDLQAVDETEGGAL